MRLGPPTRPRGEAAFVWQHHEAQAHNSGSDPANIDAFVHGAAWEYCGCLPDGAQGRTPKRAPLSIIDVDMESNPLCPKLRHILGCIQIYVYMCAVCISCASLPRACAQVRSCRRLELMSEPTGWLMATFVYRRNISSTDINRVSALKTHSDESKRRVCPSGRCQDTLG